MCPLTTPAIESAESLPYEIEKVLNFMLHNVVHYLDDGEEVSLVHFAVTDEDTMTVFDSTELPSPHLADMVVRMWLVSHSAKVVAFMTEAYTLPEQFREAYQNGTSGFSELKDHPEKQEIILLNAESPEGVWDIKVHCTMSEDGKRMLPASVVASPILDMEYPRMLVEQVPADAVVH